MTDQAKAPMTGKTINVGIYGCTKAGKTRFLFQVLDSWKKADRLLPQSEQALAFLAQVRAEIEKHGESMPTAATTEDISVRVRRDAKEPAWQLVFRDLRGELLTGEIPTEGEIVRDGVVAKQVQECDAFLFFFDPASSENPDNIDRHHQRELKRAALFIEYVIKVRENRHLPIVFVETHLDRWENDENVRTKAECWFDDVHAKLEELYGSGLRRFHPKSIVDRRCIAFSVSSVGKTQEADEQLEKVVQQLTDLVADSAAHQRWLRKTGLNALVAGAIVLALLPFVIWLLSSTGGKQHGTEKGGDRIVVAEMSEKDILAKLDELDRLLNAHPSGDQLPDVEEAKKINHHLRWLAQRLEPDSGGMTDLPEKTQQRMRSAMESVGTLVHEKTESKPHAPAALTPVLAAYLEDLPDMTPTSPALAGAQARYWQLQRDQVIGQLTDIIKRRDEVGSRPIDTLGEVVSMLPTIQQDVRRCKVFGPQARQDLVHEVETAATFCEDRKKSNSYPFVFRVVSASESSEKQAELAWRNLLVASPNRKDWLSEGGVALVPNNEQVTVDVTATVHWGQNCWDGYANSVKLQIDGVERWDLHATSKPNAKSELGVQRISRKRSDEVVFEARIRVTDGTFVYSSREHGTGQLSVKVGDLIDGERSVALDKFGNKIGITAERAGENLPNEFHTREPKYQAELGLGSPVTCVLSVHHSTADNWRKLHEFDLTTDHGPLAPLGMPLIRPDQPEVTKLLRWEGMELKLEFSGFPRVPPLLLDAAMSAKERRP